MRPPASAVGRRNREEVTVHENAAGLWLEELDEADAPMSPEEWAFNIITFGAALVALAT